MREENSKKSRKKIKIWAKEEKNVRRKTNGERNEKQSRGNGISKTKG